MTEPEVKIEESTGVGATNLTLDVQSRSRVIIIRDDICLDKINQIHIYTPLRMGSSCEIDGVTYKYSCEITPSNKIKSMSDFPKVLSPALIEEAKEQFLDFTTRVTRFLGDRGELPLHESGNLVFSIKYRKEVWD
jgi:hypothetical protein